MHTLVCLFLFTLHVHAHVHALASSPPVGARGGAPVLVRVLDDHDNDVIEIVGDSSRAPGRRPDGGVMNNSPTKDTFEHSASISAASAASVPEFAAVSLTAVDRHRELKAQKTETEQLQVRPAKNKVSICVKKKTFEKKSCHLVLGWL